MSQSYPRVSNADKSVYCGQGCVVKFGPMTHNASGGSSWQARDYADGSALGWFGWLRPCRLWRQCPRLYAPAWPPDLFRRPRQRNYPIAPVPANVVAIHPRPIILRDPVARKAPQIIDPTVLPKAKINRIRLARRRLLPGK